jgi:tetratricopeptide (TPR) repeat protein
MAAEARPTAGRRAQAILLGLVPGLAHILVLDRGGTGSVFFLLFVLGADAALAARYLLETEYNSDLFLAGAVLAAGAWLLAFLDLARLVLFRDYERRAARRAALGSEGIRSYAAGDYDAARAAFRGCLALDGRDPDALFWFGVVEARRGKAKRAARAFRRCRRYDLDRKWAREVAEQELRLRGER